MLVIYNYTESISCRNCHKPIQFFIHFSNIYFTLPSVEIIGIVFKFFHVFKWCHNELLMCYFLRRNISYNMVISFTWKENCFYEGSGKLKLWSSVMRRNSTQILVILTWKGWSFPLQIYIFKNVKSGHLKILDIDQKQLKKKTRNIYSLKQMDFYLKTGEFVTFFLTSDFSPPRWVSCWGLFIIPLVEYLCPQILRLKSQSSVG